jgi:cytochrome c peroxidase
VVAEKIALREASLASQAVGPPVSNFEMSFDGRTWPDIGKKMASMTPLAHQQVAPDDSVFGGLQNANGVGLNTTYLQLIQAAFFSEFWSYNGWLSLGQTQKLEEVPGATFTRWTGNLTTSSATTRPPGTYSLVEANFSLFFGLAVMAYEQTLVADQTPFDDWMTTGQFSAQFGAEELAGLNLFATKGRCINCHGGAEFTNASVRRAQNGRNAIEPMLMGNGAPAMYDEGFYNISVVPTVDDRSRGGADPFGAPLAFSRQFAFQALGIQNIPFPIIGVPVPDLVCDPSTGQTSCPGGVRGFIDDGNGQFYPLCIDVDGDGQCGLADKLLVPRVAVDGAFKAPGLRNVELTGPYFHNGSMGTLREVVQFYNRGGNFCRFNFADLDPDIEPIGFTDSEQQAVVAFLLSLTDPRVKYEQAPFDHPQLFVPNGHPGDENQITQVIVAPNGVVQAADSTLVVPAVGQGGSAQALTTFLGADPQSFNPVAGGNCSPQ